MPFFVSLHPPTRSGDLGHCFRNISGRCSFFPAVAFSSFPFLFGPTSPLSVVCPIPAREQHSHAFWRFSCPSSLPSFSPFPCRRFFFHPQLKIMQTHDDVSFQSSSFHDFCAGAVPFYLHGCFPPQSFFTDHPFFFLFFFRFFAGRFIWDRFESVAFSAALTKKPFYRDFRVRVFPVFFPSPSPGTLAPREGYSAALLRPPSATVSRPTFTFAFPSPPL